VVGLGQAPIGPLDRPGSGAGLQPQQPQGLTAAGIQAGPSGWLSPCSCSSVRPRPRPRRASS
jgi:hypothetical protein